MSPRRRWLWLAAVAWRFSAAVVAVSDLAAGILLFAGWILVPFATGIASWRALRSRGVRRLPTAIVAVAGGMGYAVVAPVVFVTVYLLAGGEIAYTF